VYATTSDGRRIEFEVHGDGPGLLLPQCNAPWRSFPDMLAERYRVRVVTASPRGYFGSTREGSPDAYTLTALRDDLLAAADAADLDTFIVWGYSLTAAVAAFLATTTTRVRALVAGGLPLIGSFPALVARMKRLPAQPDVPHLDWAANRALYRGLAALPTDELLSSLTCPRLCYWGSDDENMPVAMPLDQQRSALLKAGFTVEEFPGLDHISCAVRTDLVLPIIDRFLHSQVNLGANADRHTDGELCGN
jgi:pimeloyl-ACP methyl ester carboxylesterase